MKYNVNIYTTVCVRVTDVEADNQEDAVRKAVGQTDFHALLDGGKFEWAEDHKEFLVDEHGDSEHERSRWIGAEEIELEPIKHLDHVNWK